MKLFMIGMGGSVKDANIEVHDVQFAICNNKEEAFKIVKEKWYGTTLHIDSYIEVKEINGYEIDLTSSISEDLYMIVYGGYNENHIDELHDYHFVAASSKEEAKNKGKLDMSNFEDMDHVDNVVNVFESVGSRFGLINGDYSFKNNKINHTFIKIIK